MPHTTASFQHRIGTRLMLAVLLGLLATGSLAPTASAYIEQNPFQVLLSGPGRTVKCDRDVTVTATVLSAEDGEPIRQQTVIWAFSRSQSSSDRLSATSTTTNARGQTSVTVSFGPVAGARRISASASIVTSGIEIRCAGGLPDTFTAVPVGVRPPRTQLAAIAAPTVTDGQMGLTDPGIPATRLRIDRLGMDLGIVSGNGVDVPAAAAAHYPGTAWPGAGSNTFLYAHARDGLFGDLWQIRTNDVVSLTLIDGTVANYRVTDIRPVVAWDDLETLAPTDTEQLTLQTCLTYDQTAPRLVVIAQRLPAPA